jgi:CRISPR-associated protein Cmr3
MQWLAQPDIRQVVLSELGRNGPTQETRMHVSMNRETQTADEGKLFQTSGLEFTELPKPEDGQQHLLGKARRLALAVVADKPDAPSEEIDFEPCIAALGGERRMVVWRKSSATLPACPDTLLQHIHNNSACRVVLLTPACFAQGWRPTWLLEERAGVRPTLRAVAIGRPHVVSGWDFEQRGPKPTRRLAPAGSVFFLTLEGSTTAIEQWVHTLWMQCISDTEQDRRDGFGLAVVGAWNGKPQTQQV